MSQLGESDHVHPPCDWQEDFGVFAKHCPLVLSNPHPNLQKLVWSQLAAACNFPGLHWFWSIYWQCSPVIASSQQTFCCCCVCCCAVASGGARLATEKIDASIKNISKSAKRRFIHWVLPEQKIEKCKGCLSSLKYTVCQDTVSSFQ